MSLSVYCYETLTDYEIDPENYSDIFKFPKGSEVHMTCGLYDLSEEFVLGHERYSPPTESPFFRSEGTWGLYKDPGEAWN